MLAIRSYRAFQFGLGCSDGCVVRVDQINWPRKDKSRQQPRGTFERRQCSVQILPAVARGSTFVRHISSIYINIYRYLTAATCCLSIARYRYLPNQSGSGINRRRACRMRRANSVIASFEVHHSKEWSSTNPRIHDRRSEADHLRSSLREVIRWPRVTISPDASLMTTATDSSRVPSYTVTL